MKNTVAFKGERIRQNFVVINIIDSAVYQIVLNGIEIVLLNDLFHTLDVFKRLIKAIKNRKAGL
jgi:hypothetical protein